MTAEGQLFHRSCTRLLADVESAEAELAPGGGARPRGTVRVHSVFMDWLVVLLGRHFGAHSPAQEALEDR